MLLTGLRGSRASDHIGMLRGLMALAVLVYHVRYRFFVDFQDVMEPRFLALAWYSVSAYGHDAVMVFFVVSGFLVGTAVVRDCRQGSWSWAGYASARAIRLYIVLIPGLLLTAGWDVLGLRLFGQSVIYTGLPAAYHHDYFDVAARLGIRSFAGNAVFLQNIRVPTFGSNDALWSLAFEFWYYVAFPLLWIGLAARRQSVGARIAMLAAGTAIVAALPWSIVVYFPMWLLGVAVGLCPRSSTVERSARWWVIGATLACAAVVTASHVGRVRQFLGTTLWHVDYVTGVAAALLLYVLLNDRRPASVGAYGWTATRVADCSYTLYLVHLPLLVFVRAGLISDAWEPRAWTITAGLIIAIVTFAYASAVAMLFEARTNAVRRWIEGRVARRERNVFPLS